MGLISSPQHQLLIQLDRFRQPNRTIIIGAVTLDPARVGRDARRIAYEVVTYLVGLVGSSVRVTLEMRARCGESIAVRTALNC